MVYIYYGIPPHPFSKQYNFPIHIKKTMSPEQELEQLLKVLIERFGASRSLGEVYAITYYIRSVREGRNVSMSEMAEHTGISTKNISRWVRAAVERRLVTTHEHPEDHRVKNLVLIDFDDACRHLPAVAEIFGVEMEPSRMERISGKSGWPDVLGDC